MKFTPISVASILILAFVIPLILGSCNNPNSGKTKIADVSASLKDSTGYVDSKGPKLKTDLVIEADSPEESVPEKTKTEVIDEKNLEIAPPPPKDKNTSKNNINPTTASENNSKLTINANVETPLPPEPKPANIEPTPKDSPNPTIPGPEKEEPVVADKPKPEPKPEPIAKEIIENNVSPPAKETKTENPPQDDWVVPAKDQSKKNPIEADKESLSTGKTLYRKHCTSCHGKAGLGDGPKAAQLDTQSGDFTIPLFQSQTDGSIFYKTWEGRDDMPGFKKKIPDAEDIWHIVNYLRTLK